MIPLIRKDFLLTGWVHGAALFFGLGMIPVGIEKPGADLFMALFLQLMYIHLLHSFTRPGLRNGAENLLLGTLPVRRQTIVHAKYAFYLGCVAVYSLYLSLITCLTGLFGALFPWPWSFWFMPALPLMLGILYGALMIPADYISPKWSGVLGMAFYLSIIILPQKLPRWLGTELDVKAALAAMANALKGAFLPALFAACLGLLLLSMITSRHFYNKSQF